MIVPDSKPKVNERVVLLILASVQFTSIVDFMVIMPLGPQLERTLGLTPARFGLIVSSYTFAAGFAGLVSSMVIDRFARRPAFLVLYAGFLVGTLACGLAPNYATLLAARFLTGAFGGVLGGMAMAVIGDVFPEERRGRATGALMSAFALASVAGVPLGLTLGLRYGWNVPFLVLAALGLPILFVAARALPRLDDHLHQGASEHPLERLRATFAHPNHLRAFALMVTLMFGSFAVVPFLSPYLVSNAGVAESRLPLVYIVGGALTLVGAPLAGRMADRFGKLRVFRIVSPATGHPDGGRDQPAEGPAGRRRRRRGGLHGQQRRADGPGDGDDHLQRRAAPARGLPRRQLGGAAHRRGPGCVGSPA